MVATQVSRKNPDEFSRCEERSRLLDHGRSLTPGQKTDAALKGTIERALWNDAVLRAIEFYELEVHVREKIVYLDGHIASSTSQRRIQNAIRAMPGLVGIQNNLILDDKLTYEVAGALGTLEHTYGCKFFTGASHGVVTLSGRVNDENLKWLAEKCAASHPHVRAVLNKVRVSGVEREPAEQPFLQPSIGETIYFLDGLSGVVRQVILNPNNRRVEAMLLQAPAALVVVPMAAVRYLTKVSGFLHINSHERKRYRAFDPTHFSPPPAEWKAPYPYCLEDVLFLVENRQVAYPMLEARPRSPLVVAWMEPSLSEELLANDSLGA